MPVSVRYKYRLRPGKVAELALIQEWHRTRWVWNRAVHRLETNGEWVRDSELTKWRAEHDWLRAGSVVAQQQELRNFRLKRAKGKGGRKFKSAKRTQPSLNYTKRGFSVNREGRLRLPAGVVIPVVWSRELPSTPSSVRVYRDHLGHWFASFVVQQPEASFPAVSKAIGIDWGVSKLATTTDASFDLEHPQHGSRAALKLAKYQRSMARRKPQPGKRASRGYQTAKKFMAKAAKRVKRQREDDARKWANRVTKSHGFIAVENFKPGFLAKTTMARKSADGAIGLLKRTLVGIASREGRVVTLVHPKFTRLDCSKCLARTKRRLALSERSYHCLACGSIMDRDVNAAWNVLRRAGFLPTQAQGDLSPCDTEVSSG
jgi:putative transposase